MFTTFRRFPWAALLLFGLLLIAAATCAQSATDTPLPTVPAEVLAMYTPTQHLALTWQQAQPDTTRTTTDTTSAGATATLLDLRIGRPTPYAIGVVLYWTSIAEQPNVQFIVERRLNGQGEYQRVAFLPGQGAGQATHSYAFVDDGNASPQPCTYRLHQVSATTGLNQISAVQVVPGAVPGPPEPDDDKTPGPSLALD